MKLAYVIATCAALLAPAHVFAEPSSETADSIAKKALENNVFSTSNARAELELVVAKDGKLVRERRISTKIKRLADGEVRSFVEFSAPAEVAGTKFLSIQPKGQEAEQYIFLPAYKKVKRVVGSSRSDNFVGTDFSYDDLDGRNPDEAEWTRQPDAALGGQDCYVIEGRTKNPKDPYTKVVMWVHKKHLLPMRMDLYIKGGEEVAKRLTVKKLEKKEERWLATDSVMATLKKGTETRIAVVSVDFGREIPDDELTRAVLER